VKLPLTPRLVDELTVQAGRTQTVYVDTHKDAPRGFALRVRASGAKTFILIRSVREKGSRPWVSIAPGEGSGLKAARKAAARRADQITSGRDPNQEARSVRQQARAEAVRRREASGAWTVVDMLKAYRAAKLDGLARNTAYRYERHIAQVEEAEEFATLPAREVTRDNLRRLIAPIGAKTPALAHNILEFLQAAFRWAMDEEMVVTLADGSRARAPRIDRDPTRGLLKEMTRVNAAGKLVRDRFLTDEEIVEFWRGADQLAAPSAAFVRIILLNATRRDETYKAAWRNLNIAQRDEHDEPTWFIPAADRKGRAEGTPGERRPLTVPLAPLSVRILTDLQTRRYRESVRRRNRWPGLERVFVGVYFKNLIPAMRAASGITDVTLHDLRRTCATGLQRIGAPPYVISVALGHAREAGATNIDGVYTHDRRGGEHRLWLEKWAAHVEGLLSIAGRV